MPAVLERLLVRRLKVQTWGQAPWGDLERGSGKPRAEKACSKKEDFEGGARGREAGSGASSSRSKRNQKEEFTPGTAK